jgi:radial spoke head protein 1
MSEEGGDGQKY